MKVKYVGINFVVACCICFSQISGAEQASGNFTAKVIATYEDADGDGDREFGGCLVRVIPDPSTVLAGCKNKYVAPSCDGTYGSSSRSTQQILEQIQIAALTGKTIKLGLDNAKKHSGYCFVNFAQVSF